ncbi:MAG: glycosyltransferase family 2 protein [Nitrososphaerota archaeon]|nr:glycosyltransferase family 2 protein [Nitrososphaerota archaeon]
MDPALLALAAAAWLAGAALFGLTAYSLALFAYGRSLAEEPPDAFSATPEVTALVASLGGTPALDETLRRLAGVKYPALELAVALGPSAQPPRGVGKQLTLVRSPSAGKARALNAAIGAVRSRYLLLLDEDSLVEPDCIDRLLPLADAPGTWAVVGVPYPSNAGAGPLQGTLALEAEAWAAAAKAKDRLGLFLPATGFFSFIPVAALGPGGGEVWDEGALAEDADLSLRQLAKGLRVRLSTARVGIEAPGTLGALARQRLRWYKGMLDALWKNRRVVARLRPALAADVVLSFLAPLAPAGFVVLAALSPLWPSALVPVVLGAAMAYAASAWLSASKLKGGRAGVMLLSLPYALVQGAVALAALGAFLFHVRVRWQRTPKEGDAQTRYA